MLLTRIIKWLYIIFFAYEWYKHLLWIYLASNHETLSHYELQDLFANYILFGSSLQESGDFYSHGVIEAAISFALLIALLSQNKKLGKVEYGVLLTFGILAAMLNFWQIL